jgi:hypothetical protein
VDDYDGLSESPPVARDGSALPNSANWSRTVAVVWVDPLDPTQVKSAESGAKRITVVAAFRNVPQATVVAGRTAHGAELHLGCLIVDVCSGGLALFNQQSRINKQQFAWQIELTPQIRHPQSAIRTRHCRGSIYLYVLTSSLLVTILGLGSLAAVRLQMRSERLAQDSAGARIYAVSAVEMGLLQDRKSVV